MADNTLGAYNIADLRELALKRVPKGLFEFVDRGTEDEVSLRNNRAVFERIRFRPRTLIDVKTRSQEITLFGHKQKMPIVIAPTGTAGLMWHEGELALGAQAVLIGRATLYGTAAGGEAGAARAIAILREEIDRVLALLGCRSVADLGPEYLHTVDPWFGPIIEGELRQKAEFPKAVAQA